MNFTINFEHIVNDKKYSTQVVIALEDNAFTFTDLAKQLDKHSPFPQTTAIKSITQGSKTWTTENSKNKTINLKNTAAIQVTLTSLDLTTVLPNELLLPILRDVNEKKFTAITKLSSAQFATRTQQTYTAISDIRIFDQASASWKLLSTAKKQAAIALLENPKHINQLLNLVNSWIQSDAGTQHFFRWINNFREAFITLYKKLTAPTAQHKALFFLITNDVKTLNLKDVASTADLITQSHPEVAVSLNSTVNFLAWNTNRQDNPPKIWRTCVARYCNLQGISLRWANISKENLSGINFSGADLSGANLSGADLSRTNLSETYLSGTNLSETDLSGVNLSEKDLSGTNFSRANLSGANFSRAKLLHACFEKANLENANLSDTYLLKEAILRLASKEKSAAQKNVALSLEEALILENLSKKDGDELDLEKTNLLASLSHNKLAQKRLAEEESAIHSAQNNLASSYIYNINNLVDLSEINFSGANLSGVNLSLTNLSRANLSGAIFDENTDLTDTNLTYTIFENIKGLDKIKTKRLLKVKEATLKALIEEINTADSFSKLVDIYLGNKSGILFVPIKPLFGDIRSWWGPIPTTSGNTLLDAISKRAVVLLNLPVEQNDLLDELIIPQNNKTEIKLSSEEQEALAKLNKFVQLPPYIHGEILNLTNNLSSPILV